MTRAAKEFHATVLYTAVRDYTRIVNILDLKETHSFLSDCTEVIQRAAVANRGSLANVLGDQLYFVFVNPKAEFDNPKNAVKCALAIQNTADEISIRWRHALNFLVEIDLGISTGNIIVTNLGSTPKNQFTLVGKNATLATELGRLCKAHNVNILLDIATYDNSKNYFTFRKVGNRPILGFTERIDLYTPLSGLT